MPKPTKTSPPAWPCCSFPKDAGPSHGQGAIPFAAAGRRNGCRLESPSQRRQQFDVHVESKWRMEIDLADGRSRQGHGRRPLAGARAVLSGGGDPLPESEENARGWPPTSATTSTAAVSFSPTANPAPASSTRLPRSHATGLPRARVSFQAAGRSHPVWTADQKIPPEQVRLLLGIDYGCRTSVVYAPFNTPGDPRPSLACLWELSRGGQRSRYSPAVQDQIQGGLAIGINVLAYATNRELKPKDVIPETGRDKGPADHIDRGKFAVAKLEHLGGCDAAPRALANLMEQAGHDLNIRVETHPKLIDIQDPALFDYPMVFMHGRNAFRLTDDERKALREYVERGGLLFADAICGNEALPTRSAARWALIFPKTPWRTSRLRSDLDQQVRRRRSRRSHAPRPPAGQARASRPSRPFACSARVEGRSLRRPLRRDLLGVRSELCPGEARFDGMPRLHPRRRRRIGLNVLRYAIQQ